MSGERWRELAAAHALEALDPDEREAFEARLAVDPELRALVDAYRAVAARIGTETPRADPPAALRERILARARVTPQEHEGGGTMGATGGGGRSPSRAGPDGAGASSPTTATDGAGGPDIRPLGGRSRRATAVPWLAAAAAVAALVAVGLENRELRTGAETLQAEVERLRGDLADARVDVARLDSLTLLLSGEGIRLAALRGEGAPPSIRLLWNPELGTLLVAARDLPALPPNRTYQLWGIRGADAPVSLGTFATGPEGRALVTRALASPPDFDVSAVTEEPAGGSPQPTSQPFLVGSWTAAPD